MTQDELDNHDCKKGLEDGCNCDKVKVTDEQAEIRNLVDESIEADVEDLNDGGGDDYGYDNFAQEERGASEY